MGWEDQRSKRKQVIRTGIELLVVVVVAVFLVSAHAQSAHLTYVWYAGLHDSVLPLRFGGRATKIVTADIRRNNTPGKSSRIKQYSGATVNRAVVAPPPGGVGRVFLSTLPRW